MDVSFGFERARKPSSDVAVSAMALENFLPSIFELGYSDHPPFPSSIVGVLGRVSASRCLVLKPLTVPLSLRTFSLQSHPKTARKEESLRNLRSTRMGKEGRDEK